MPNSGKFYELVSLKNGDSGNFYELERTRVTPHRQ